MAITTDRVQQQAALGHSPRLGYVRALDGLRAYAVLAVMAFHLQWPVIGGGFLGVDLFFVLSGFLITAILLQTTSSNHLRGDLAHFYLRRTRRLLPALTLMLFAVGAWAALIALPEQIQRLRDQGLGTVFYVSNWVFLHEESTYFDAFADPSPLQHTWSLAIEEQFYLLWPVFVLVLLARRHRKTLFTITFFTTLASAAAMWIVAGTGAMNTAYLSSFTRVHELTIGALAALIATWTPQRTHRRTRPAPITLILAVTGMIIAGAMVFLSPQGFVYYQGGSVVFSIATATLIVILVRHRPNGGTLLGNRVLVWIGTISYGLYLWHWPMIVWLTPATTSLDELGLDALRILATFAAASLSFYLVEQPIKRGGWPHIAISKRAWWWAVPTSMAITAGLIIMSTASASSDTDASPVTHISKPDHLLGSPEGTTMLIVGDSVPQELMPELGEFAAKSDMRIIPLAFGGCSVVGAFQVDVDGGAFPWSRRCTEVTSLQDQVIAEHSPDIIVWYSNRERLGIRDEDGGIAQAGTVVHRRLMEQQIFDTAERFTTGGARLIIVQPAPKAIATIGRCSREPESGDCAASANQIDSFTWLRAVYSQVSAELPRVNLINVDDLLCPTGTPCAIEEFDGSPIRPDGVHIAHDLEPWFAQILLQRIIDVSGPQR